MTEVNLVIDGRSYGIACDDGQERRLQQLGAYVEQRIREVSGGGGVNKAQNMVLASLVLADEVFDLSDKLSKKEQEIPVSSGEQPTYITYDGLPPQEEHNVVQLIGQMAARVEKLTARVHSRKSA